MEHDQSQQSPLCLSPDSTAPIIVKSVIISKAISIPPQAVFCHLTTENEKVKYSS